jgi:chloramphenicol-sensitive protein RarD
VLMYGEVLAPATLTAFLFIWAGLAVYSVDIWLHLRKQRPA